MGFTVGGRAAALVIGALLLAACSAGGGSAGSTSGGKVELTFWSWVPNLDQVVAKWNTAHPDIHVTVSNQAQGDALVTKLLTAAQAGNPPDLMQVEYQALPTLVSNDVLANVASQAGPAKSKFASGVWNE